MGRRKHDNLCVVPKKCSIFNNVNVSDLTMWVWMCEVMCELLWVTWKMARFLHGEGEWLWICELLWFGDVEQPPGDTSPIDKAIITAHNAGSNWPNPYLIPCSESHMHLFSRNAARQQDGCSLYRIALTNGGYEVGNKLAASACFEFCLSAYQASGALPDWAQARTSFWKWRGRGYM